MTPRRRIVPVFVPHVGCPHRCVFCDQRTISGQTEAAGPETVQEALRSAQAVSAWAELAFYGGSFTGISPEMQTELLEAALRKKRKKITKSIPPSIRKSPKRQRRRNCRHRIIIREILQEPRKLRSNE